jgi:hypothetical protein
MASPSVVPNVAHMSAQLLVQLVEVSFVGTPPVRQIERASGVSGVERDGSIVRCLVEGSFQPFLEALRGHEVLTLQATPAIAASSRREGGIR